MQNQIMHYVECVRVTEDTWLVSPHYYALCVMVEFHICCDLSCVTWRGPRLFFSFAATSQPTGWQWDISSSFLVHIAHRHLETIPAYCNAYGTPPSCAILFYSKKGILSLACACRWWNEWILHYYMFHIAFVGFSFCLRSHDRTSI